MRFSTHVREIVGSGCFPGGVGPETSCGCQPTGSRCRPKLIRTLSQHKDATDLRWECVFRIPVICEIPSACITCKTQSRDKDALSMIQTWHHKGPFSAEIQCHIEATTYGPVPRSQRRQEVELQRKSIIFCLLYSFLPLCHGLCSCTHGCAWSHSKSAQFPLQQLVKPALASDGLWIPLAPSFCMFGSVWVKTNMSYF